MLREHTEKLTAPQLIETLAAESVARKARAALTCSFQAEDMIVLQLLRQQLSNIPVLFLETGYHFAAVYEFRDRIAREWKLNLVNVIPGQTVQQQESTFGILNQTDPTRCCQLRKVEPLMRSLDEVDVWFTGLRREQSPTRANIAKVEEHILPSGRVIVKANPLADWNWKQVWSYIVEQNIPYLPLYDHGYLSIGCEPCTSLPANNDPRSGRWAGRKQECGIHTFSQATGQGH